MRRPRTSSRDTMTTGRTLSNRTSHNSPCSVARTSAPFLPTPTAEFGLVREELTPVLRLPLVEGALILGQGHALVGSEVILDLLFFRPALEVLAGGLLDPGAPVLLGALARALDLPEQVVGQADRGLRRHRRQYNQGSYRAGVYAFSSRPRLWT